jgi:hypothetical protein
MSHGPAVTLHHLVLEVGVVHAGEAKTGPGVVDPLNPEDVAPPDNSVHTNILLDVFNHFQKATIVLVKCPR